MQALKIEKLSKTYSNGVEALKSIDLSVESGDFFALLGPNGAGKSTTIGIITSLVNKTAGKVSVFGYDLETDLEIAKQHIGVVPQEINFSVFETCKNILITQAGYYGVPRKTALQRADHYLYKLGLYEKRNSQVRALSGGMKRRLMIARALVHEPKLLILDEPTAGVDIEIRRHMWEFLTEINQAGVTVILTTHYLEEAEKLCRNIAIINHGEIIANTDLNSLLSELTTETFILNLETAIETAPELDGFNCKLLSPNSLSVDVSKQQSINALFQQLSQTNIQVSSLRNKANRLEELFIGLTQGNNDASKN